MSEIKKALELVELGRVASATKGNTTGKFRENGSTPFCLRDDNQETKGGTPCFQ